MERRRIAFGAATAVFLVVGSAAATAGDRLTGPELRALYSGSTSRGINAKGRPFVVNYRADGTLDGVVTVGSGGATITDTGTWTLKGGWVCHTWTRFFHGQTVCVVLERIPGKDGWYRSIAGNGKSGELQFSKN